MSPDNSLMVACEGVVVVTAARNAIAEDDVVAMDGVVVAIGAAVAVVVWVQQC